ncbi:MAG: hypothetical protein Q8K75_03595 [Chlamydiales bacterium]|nr:hypothetical protein [Chlamydiales bacterium]
MVHLDLSVKKPEIGQVSLGEAEQVSVERVNNTRILQRSLFIATTTAASLALSYFSNNLPEIVLTDEQKTAMKVCVALVGLVAFFSEIGCFARR